jgi:hypothetical protein
MEALNAFLLPFQFDGACAFLKFPTWPIFCCFVRRFTDLARSLAGRKATVKVLMTDEMHLILVQDPSIREHFCN